MCQYHVKGAKGGSCNRLTDSGVPLAVPPRGALIKAKVVVTPASQGCNLVGILIIVSWVASTTRASEPQKRPGFQIADWHPKTVLTKWVIYEIPILLFPNPRHWIPLQSRYLPTFPLHMNASFSFCGKYFCGRTPALRLSNTDVFVLFTRSLRSCTPMWRCLWRPSSPGLGEDEFIRQWSSPILSVTLHDVWVKAILLYLNASRRLRCGVIHHAICLFHDRWVGVIFRLVAGGFPL